MKALLVIDMQSGIFEDFDYVLDYQNELFEIVNHAIDQARNKNIPILFVQHTESEGLVEDSDAWQLDRRLHKEKNDFVFSKHHSDAFWDTPLMSYCDQHSIDELILCGVQSDYCIDTSVRSAHRLGYKVQLISDGHSTVKNSGLTVRQIIDHHNEILHSFARVVPLESIDF